MRRARLILLAMVTIGIAPSMSSGQEVTEQTMAAPPRADQGQPEVLDDRLVPEDLALRLIREEAELRYGASMELLLDRPPAELVPFVPEELSFRAALRSGDRLTSFWSASAGLDELFERFREVLDATGLEPRPLDTNNVFHPTPDAFPLHYCSRVEDELIVVDARGSDGAVTDVSIRRSEGSSAQTCGSTGWDRRQEGGVPLPVLTLLPGVEVGSAGSTRASGVDFLGMSGSFATSLSPADLVGHLADQMADQAWYAGAGENLGMMALQTFSHVDGEGDWWLALLVLTRARDGENRLLVDFSVRGVPDP